jgi:putative DNA methylase
MTDDHRLIEDYIPIEAISAEARREKSIRKGHISTLHLWWARRPLVACRAAVYGALVPAPENKEAAKEAARFVTDLCKYPGSKHVVAEAQEHILEAHAERLTEERGELVTVGDIKAGRAPRPRVLDMFAGGGAIPLEALRLGCEAYALDLNPVAHLIELCTLVYPQRYGQPDPAAVGCADPSAGSGQGGTWAGLAAEVEHWGNWVLERVREEIGDLYPPIPDPRHSERSEESPEQLSLDMAVKETQEVYDARAGMLTPVAYLWTRTVRCKNPACGGTVPLARQTWLCKKKGRYVALRPDAETNCDEPPGEKTVRYEVVEATTERGLGFNPSSGSRGGNVPCPFCGTVADSDYVKAEGQAGRIGVQSMAVVCTHPEETGKVYLEASQAPTGSWPNDKVITQRISALETEMLSHQGDPITVPNERIITDSKGSAWVIQYGLESFGDLFTVRQLLALLCFAKQVRAAHTNMLERRYGEGQATAVTSYLALNASTLADWNSAACTWISVGEKIGHTLARQALPMVWDFAEINPFGNASGNTKARLQRTVAVIRQESSGREVSGTADRGSATALPYDPGHFDAVITDPPYYDNVAYADLSDFFYVWLRRSIGFLYPQHFSSALTPKKREAVADATRHNGDRDIASEVYEGMMAQSFAEAGRVLKSGAPLIIVYAHKTTLGWATLIDALRDAGFTVTEAWPLDTERAARIRAMDTASLASSIFLIARRREGDETGSYEREVRPELQRIVRERVERLWAQGITGADLVIACVGAGLRAFTRYARVEYANGEPVPADSFLAEVEGVVLETLLEKLFGVSQAGVGRVDSVTRFYVLWRYAYRHATLDAGEAIVFAYPQRVELDGPGGLTAGTNPLMEKKKGKYRLRDFAERGEDEDLGLPRASELPSLIDALHRVLWLVEHRPAMIPAYLDEAQPDVERLRLVAQTLAGQTLTGNSEGGGRSLVAAKGAEASALRKLTTNWRSLVEAHRGPMV